MGASVARWRDSASIRWSLGPPARAKMHTQHIIIEVPMRQVIQMRQMTWQPMKWSRLVEQRIFPVSGRKSEGKHPLRIPLLSAPKGHSA